MGVVDEHQQGSGVPEGGDGIAGGAEGAGGNPSVDGADRASHEGRERTERDAGGGSGGGDLHRGEPRPGGELDALARQAGLADTGATGQQQAGAFGSAERVRDAAEFARAPHQGPFLHC